ncbi:S8 family serine peptidase [Bacillus sp. AFS029533]|uniref:S8 family peptidase n=1 Tax=Bacillus sp. AFS029533 TaxID=2033494 RepID=UPI0015D485B2|nr:S8 family serine peptidase [Bacillus sp. AFS029533]
MQDFEDIWKISDGSTQTIAIIDTGITNEAKLLYKNKIVDTYNSINNNKNVRDEHTQAHGTQMASILCSDGQKNIKGVSPKSKIIIIKAIGAEGSQKNTDSIIKAVTYAINKKVHVINMSFGSFQVNEKIKKQINLAINNNITVVASTGDYGNKDSLFPASMKGVVSVEAKNENGEIWENSNTSKEDVFAMYGENIKVLSTNNKVIKMNGTSYATAMASGYIALLRDYYQKNNISFDNDKIIKDLKLLKSTQNNDVDYLKLFKK